MWDCRNINSVENSNKNANQPFWKWNRLCSLVFPVSLFLSLPHSLTHSVHCLSLFEKKNSKVIKKSYPSVWVYLYICVFCMPNNSQTHTHTKRRRKQIRVQFVCFFLHHSFDNFGNFCVGDWNVVDTIFSFVCCCLVNSWLSTRTHAHTTMMYRRIHTLVILFSQINSRNTSIPTKDRRRKKYAHT